MHVSIMERSKGVWRIRIETRDEKRQRKFKYETLKGLKKDAEARRLALLQAGGEKIKTSEEWNVTLADYCDAWLARRLSMKEITQQTYENYAYVIDRVRPHLGHVRVRDITKEQVEAVVVNLLSIPQTRSSRRALSTRVVRQVIERLRGIVDTAVMSGLIPRNVFRMVAKPKQQNTHKMETIFEPQLRKLLADMRSEPTKGPIIRFAIATGCRRGEICALRWSDIDWAARAVHIRRTTAQPKGAAMYEKAPKSKSGIRTIRLPEEQMEELAAMYEVRACDHVFPSHGRYPRHPNGLTQEVSLLLRKYGLGQFTLHDLRHAHATMLLRSRENPNAVQRRLGHADVGITLRVYGHVLPQDDASLTARVANLFSDPV